MGLIGTHWDSLGLIGTHSKNRVVEANSAFYDEPTVWAEKLRFFESIGKAAKPRRQTQISDAKDYKLLTSSVFPWLDLPIGG